MESISLKWPHVEDKYKFGNRDVIVKTKFTSSASVPQDRVAYFAKTAAIGALALSAILMIAYQAGWVAWGANRLMLPAQYACPGEGESKSILNHEREKLRIDHFEIFNGELKGVIYNGKKSIFDFLSSPRPDHFDRCILYNNPNGMVASDLLSRKDIKGEPWEDLAIYLQAIAECPVILYDYRGTGLNSEAPIYGESGEFPTAVSIVQDGIAAIQYADGKCDRVDVFGTSLGGGVATIALDQYLTENENANKAKFRLYNHDSFTTTARVVLPEYPNVADWLGKMTETFLDAETALKSLADKEIPIVILSATRDPVIPENAAMGKAIEPQENIKVLLQDHHDRHHATLWPYENQLRSLNPPFNLKV